VRLKENEIIGRLIPAGTGLPRYRSLEPTTPGGEQIIIESPTREDRMILPMDMDESLALVGSSFIGSVDKGAAEAELGAGPDICHLWVALPLGRARLLEGAAGRPFDHPRNSVCRAPAPNANQTKYAKSLY